MSTGASRVVSAPATSGSNERPAKPEAGGANPGVAGGRDPRGGVVLPLLLLFLLALTALATIAIHSARQEVVVSRASIRLLQSRLSAEGGVRMAMAEVGSERVRRLREGHPEEILTGELVPAGRFRVQGHRLRSGFFMLEGVGIPAGAEGGEVRVGRLVRVLDPVREVASFRAALEHGGERSEGTVTGEEVATAPREWPVGVCSPFRTTLDSIFPFGSLQASAAVAAVAAVEPPDPTLLGNLTFEELFDLSPRQVEGSWAPRPEGVAGACSVDLVSNWGAPSSPDGACGPHLPLVVSATSLHLTGGEGQGVLVVAEDLEMSGGMRFAGLVLVGGDLRLSETSRIEGLVRVKGNVLLGPDTSISGAGCAVLRALVENPVLNRILPVTGGSWVGAF